MLTFFKVGFLDDQENSALKEAIPWKEATQKILGTSGNSEEELTKAILSKATIKDEAQLKQILEGLRWIGIVGLSKNVRLLE
jgi:saccharopine dehydrogenase (NADP+, L-glutamate forming)